MVSSINVFVFPIYLMDFPPQFFPPFKVKSEIPDGLTSGQISHDVLFQLPL